MTLGAARRPFLRPPGARKSFRFAYRPVCGTSRSPLETRDAPSVTEAPAIAAATQPKTDDSSRVTRQLAVCVVLLVAARLIAIYTSGFSPDEAYVIVLQRKLALSYFDHPAAASVDLERLRGRVRRGARRPAAVPGADPGRQRRPLWHGAAAVLAAGGRLDGARLQRLPLLSADARRLHHSRYADAGVSGARRLDTGGNPVRTAGTRRVAVGGGRARLRAGGPREIRRRLSRGRAVGFSRVFPAPSPLVVRPPPLSQRRAGVAVFRPRADLERSASMGVVPVPDPPRQPGADAGPPVPARLPAGAGDANRHRHALDSLAHGRARRTRRAGGAGQPGAFSACGCAPRR